MKASERPALDALVTTWESEAHALDRRPGRTTDLTSFEQRIVEMHARVLRECAKRLRDALKVAADGRR